MPLRLLNTLTGAKDEFQPLEPGRVGVYTCGPTVWNYAHIGNFRAFLFNDLLRRHLRFSGYEVRQVMNITDIDDRILKEAEARGIRIDAYTEPYEAAFFEDLRALRVQPAEIYPRATRHISEMVALIERLLETGHAYQADGDVYFRISTFPAYGALAKLDRAGLKTGARVAADKYDKESATDFALWKAAGPQDVGVGASWPAPFGNGRPGWHIECSAMSMEYLGETFDIHCGGIDLMFPHHENEIAQSEAATGKPFARWWLHSEHVADATGAKMSKSEGNFSTLRDLVAAGHDPVAIRFFLIANAHYRSRLRLEDAGLHAAAEQVRRLRELAVRAERLEPAAVDDSVIVQEVADARRHYRAALDDDLNLPQGIGYVFDAVRRANAALDRGEVGAAGKRELLGLLADADAHLDVLDPGVDALEPDLAALIDERERARAARDFTLADSLRIRLAERGIVLEDSKEGVRWRRAR